MAALATLSPFKLLSNDQAELDSATLSLRTHGYAVLDFSALNRQEISNEQLLKLFEDGMGGGSEYLGPFLRPRRASVHASTLLPVEALREEAVRCAPVISNRDIFRDIFNGTQ